MSGLRRRRSRQGLFTGHKPNDLNLQDNPDHNQHNTDIRVDEEGSLLMRDLKIDRHSVQARREGRGKRASRRSISLSDDYEEDCLLGSGTTGTVYRAFKKGTREVVALKVIQLNLNDERVWRHVLSEVRVMSGCECDSIVACYGAGFREGKITIAMEYMDTNVKELLDTNGPLGMEAIGKIAVQVLGGLQYLHRERELVHRDIKPANLLVNRLGVIKIGDLGLSTSVAASPSVGGGFSGTVLYMSPERAQGKPYSFTSDIWSLGVTLLECARARYPLRPQLISRPPPPPSDAPDGEGKDEGGEAKAEGGEGGRKSEEGGMQYWDIVDFQPSQYSLEGLPETFANFISLCLEPNPDARPSSTDLNGHKFVEEARQSKFDLAAYLQTIPVPTPRTRKQ